MTSRTTSLTTSQLETVSAMQDWFTPEVAGFPSITEADPDGAVLLLALDQLAPSQAELFAAIDDAGADVPAYLERLERADQPAFLLLRTLLVGRYLTCRPVWQVLGYAGRRPVPIAPGEADAWLADGLMESSIARGKIYRPTP